VKIHLTIRAHPNALSKRDLHRQDKKDTQQRNQPLFHSNLHKSAIKIIRISRCHKRSKIQRSPFRSIVTLNPELLNLKPENSNTAITILNWATFYMRRL
jgi:hypothetical protein